MKGVLWDEQESNVVIEALHAVSSPPARSDVELDSGDLNGAATLIMNSVETIQEPVIFGGYLITHFGHFLHECLGRLWWLGKDDAVPVVVNSARVRLQKERANVYFFINNWGDQGVHLTSYMIELLEGLGLPADRIRIIVEPVRFEHILIPVQGWGFRYNRRAWDEYLGCDCRQLTRSLLGSYDIPTVAETDPFPKKLYVSRSRLPLNLGRLIGDVLLDKLLAKGGYEVFYPESHGISEQIRIYSQVKDIIFMDGSAPYLLWFCRLQAGTRITIILRRRQGHWVSRQLQQLLPDTANLRVRILDELIGEELTSAKDWESHNLVDLAALNRQLVPFTALPPDEVKMVVVPYVKQLMRHSSEEQINGILVGLIANLVREQSTLGSSAHQLALGVCRRLLSKGRRLQYGLGRLAGWTRRPFTSR